MKNFVAVLGLLSLSNAALADKTCWDGTFGYNYARAVETKDTLEISITGSNLELPPLSVTHGSTLVFNSFALNTPQLHLVIPRSAVKSSKGTLTANIHAAADDIMSQRTPSLWVEHHVQDLNEYKTVLSPVPLLGFKAAVAEDAITLDITQLWGYTDEGQNLRSRIEVPCMNDNAPDSLRVPDRLKKFLTPSNPTAR
ncbi:MAG TPA: hypothetical protein VE954_17195 [Oligoflexus sp.]|uniref:hypothetical protein n=1 Tax=Oligoflexus sp. TaxID=1971216 RepID=UPI002D55AA31|nr:hypothetical protein [Oligoflexus sp.]HYX34836.1 hypothetical protein [Oligoflexus sp.]